MKRVAPIACCSTELMLSRMSCLYIVATYHGIYPKVAVYSYWSPCQVQRPAEGMIPPWANNDVVHHETVQVT